VSADRRSFPSANEAVPTQLEESEQLHHEVRAFVRASLSSRVPTSAAAPSEEAAFSQLALRIAAYQRRYVAGYARLVDAHARAMRNPETIATIVPVPADAFRYSEVFAFDVTAASTRFRTSGTTAVRGAHYLRSTLTYTEVLLHGARRSFPLGSGAAPIVVALAPQPGSEPSSLAFMMQRLMETVDGRSLDASRASAGFELNEPRRWLMSEAGVDWPAVEAVLSLAQALATPVWMLATSFALVQWFDSCGTRRFKLPAGSLVMQTGGFKGRTRELDPRAILDLVTQHFGPSYVVNEYGMTELCSQLYNVIALEAAEAHDPQVFVEPPWLRVLARDPITHEALEDGQVGLANFVDLGNVDSAVSVLTQDLVRREATGIRLLGRNPGAPLRGCSLAIEELFTRGK
jgi:hypothetical protein